MHILTVSSMRVIALEIANKDLAFSKSLRRHNGHWIYDTQAAGTGKRNVCTGSKAGKAGPGEGKANTER